MDSEKYTSRRGSDGEDEAVEFKPRLWLRLVPYLAWWALVFASVVGGTLRRSPIWPLVVIWGVVLVRGVPLRWRGLSDYTMRIGHSAVDGPVFPTWSGVWSVFYRGRSPRQTIALGLLDRDRSSKRGPIARLCGLYHLYSANGGKEILLCRWLYARQDARRLLDLLGMG